MTKEEFEESYIIGSSISAEFYHRHLITLPCDCGMEGCNGWAAVVNTKENIENHIFFYGTTNGCYIRS